MTKYSLLQFIFASVFLCTVSFTVTAQINIGAQANTETSTTTAPPPLTEPEPEPEPEPAPFITPAPVSTTISQTAAPATGSSDVAGYKGGFFIQSPDEQFKLKINGMAKFRYSLLSIDRGEDDAGDEIDRRQLNLFSVPYTRLLFTGNMFGKDLTYSIYFDIHDGASLKYAYADYAFVKNKLHLRAGKFKRSFSRNFISSSVKRQFVNSLMSEMGQAIDLGIQLSNNYTAVEGLEWAIGIFNGQTITRTVGLDDFSPMLVGRIGYNSGIKGYSPVDMEGGSLRFGVALSAATELDANDDEITNSYIDIDAIMKVEGFSLSGAVYLQAASQEGLFDESNYSGMGIYGQAGYLIGKFIEPVARFELLNPDNDLVNNTMRATGGLTFYFHNHNFKLENNFILDSSIADDSDDYTYNNFAFMSQMQFFF